MPIQISELPGQPHLGGDLHTNFFKAALKQFVEQFSLMGCGVFQSHNGSPKPSPIAYWSQSEPSPLLPTLAPAIDWQQMATLERFEVLPIEHPNSAVQFYGCLLRRTPQVCDYLLCWQATPLSPHQQYGISLFAQALISQFLPTQGQASTSEKFHQARHQLRTPLSLVLLYADLLKTTPLDSRSQEWLENLRSVAESMHVSLDHLLDPFTQADLEDDRGGDPCDLRAVLEQCSREMQPWLQAKQLKLVLDSRPLRLPVNEWKLKQVFQNLLSNAIAFSPKAGQITWEWQTFQTEVLIKISDQGPGLSATDLRSIGTPFYSRRPGGTGLGLSIAKQVILEHQGSLWADNLPSGGAQFCILLPRS